MARSCSVPWLLLIGCRVFSAPCLAASTGLPCAQRSCLTHCWMVSNVLPTTAKISHCHTVTVFRHTFLLACRPKPKLLSFPPRPPQRLTCRLQHLRCPARVARHCSNAATWPGGLCRQNRTLVCPLCDVFRFLLWAFSVAKHL